MAKARAAESAWNSALVVPLEYETQPGENIDAPVETEALITYDSDALYVGFRAYDPEPDKIVANRMARSEILFYDDGFNIQLDTFHDRRNGFFFQVNPNGGRRDGSFARDFFEENWDGIWYASATALIFCAAVIPPTRLVSYCSTDTALSCCSWAQPRAW